MRKGTGKTAHDAVYFRDLCFPETAFSESIIPYRLIGLGSSSLHLRAKGTSGKTTEVENNVSVPQWLCCTSGRETGMEGMF